jgi:hypothetical protein
MPPSGSRSAARAIPCPEAGYRIAATAESLLSDRQPAWTLGPAAGTGGLLMLCAAFGAKQLWKFGCGGDKCGGLRNNRRLAQAEPSARSLGSSSQLKRLPRMGLKFSISTNSWMLQHESHNHAPKEQLAPFILLEFLGFTPVFGGLEAGVELFALLA